VIKNENIDITSLRNKNKELREISTTFNKLDNERFCINSEFVPMNSNKKDKNHKLTNT